MGLRIQRLFIGLIALLAFAFAWAEGPAEPLEAVDIVAAAHRAAGGAAWVRPESLLLKGSAVMYRDGRLDAATVVEDYAMWREFPAWNESAREASGKVRIDALTNGQVLFQIAFDGVRSYDQNGLVEEAEATREWSAAFGFGIIRFALDEGFTLARLADDQVEGHASYVVAVTDPDGHETVFWVERDGFAIRKVGFDTPRGWHERIYSDFELHQDPQFTQPTRVRLYYNGRMTSDIDWQHYEVNQPIADEVFVIGARQNGLSR